MADNITERPIQSNNPLAPLAIPVYRTFWIAGLFSNIGTWMHETGAIWLMTELRPSPEMVAYVRVAMAVPVFLLALPAGVWADRFDRRSWLLATQSFLLSIALLMALSSLMGWLSPSLLLVLTAIMGSALILNLPAWQALTPELVPPELIPSAVQAGSVSFNLARSIGPALAGVLIAHLGVGAAFLFNALSFLGIMTALILWRPVRTSQLNQDPDQDSSSSEEPPSAEVLLHPRSRPFARSAFVIDLLKGIAVIRSSLYIRHSLIRVLVFAFSASSLWSLLSLIATDKMGFRERGFGTCLAMLGIGAVLAAGILPWFRQRASSDAIVLLAQIIMACLLFFISWTNSVYWIMASLLLIGACWMSKMTTLNSTAQVYLPRKFRARGMSSFVMSFALGMTLGSLTWGWLARLLDLNIALAAAGITMAVMAIATHRLTLGSLRTPPQKP